MSTELKTIDPRKWTGDFSGISPTLDTSDGVRVGDLAIETGATNTDRTWIAIDVTEGASIWGDMSHASYPKWTNVASDIIDGAIDLSYLAHGGTQYADIGSGASLTITGSTLSAAEIIRFNIKSTADVTISAAQLGFSTAVTCTTWQELLVSRDPSGVITVRLASEVS